MHGLQQLLAFAETAKHGGFAAAAREQGQAPSTLAKAVARLERRLGIRLFHRTTREVRLTPDGERLFRRCERVLAELDDLYTEASGARAAPSGLLRVTAPVDYGRRHVLPTLIELQRKHPGLRLDVRLSDSQVDLVRDGIDLAVRIGALADSSLVARRVDQQQLLLCATPGYLAERGVPRRLDELAGHAAIVFRLPSTGRDRPWQFRQRGVPVELRPQPVVRAYESDGLLVALKSGVGLCQIPDVMVDDELDRGELVEVLPSCRPEPMPIHLVHPSGRLVPARLRAAIDALDALRQRRLRR